MQMRYPDWYRSPWENQIKFNEATDEQIEAWRLATLAMDARWKEEYQPTVKHIGEAINTFKMLYGEKSNIYKYLTNRRTRPEYLATDRMRWVFDSALDRRKEYLKQKAQAESTERRDAEIARHQQENKARIAAIAVEFNLTSDDPEEMLKALCAQHKYLALYIGGYMARCYWGDNGRWHAEHALDEFKVRTDLTPDDRIIIKEWAYVLGQEPEDDEYFHVEDGRTFRDMEFGYDALSPRVPVNVLNAARFLAQEAD